MSPSHFPNESFPLFQVSPTHFLSQTFSFFLVRTSHFSKLALLIFRVRPSHFFGSILSTFPSQSRSFLSQTFPFLGVSPNHFSKSILLIFQVRPSNIIQQTSLISLRSSFILHLICQRNVFFSDGTGLEEIAISYFYAEFTCTEILEFLTV